MWFVCVLGRGEERLLEKGYFSQLKLSFGLKMGITQLCDSMSEQPVCVSGSVKSLLLSQTTNGSGAISNEI